MLAFRLPAAAASRSLVVHLDINKTIAMVDQAGGKSQLDVCCELTAEQAMGFCPRPPPTPVSPSDRHGSPTSPPVSWTRLPLPTSVLVTGDRARAAQISSYKTFVDTVALPLPPPPVDADTVAAIRGERKALTCHYGRPTSSTYEREAWAQAQELRDALSRSRDPFVVDAAVALLDAAVTAVASGGLASFGLVFRTFGSELDAVRAALARAVDAGVAAAEAAGKPVMAAVWRGLHPAAATTRAAELVRSGTDAVTMVMDDGRVAAQDVCGVRRELLSHLVAPGAARVMFVRDEFAAWSRAGEAAHAGKLFALDGERGQAPAEIFFDDNLRPRDERSIVDVRFVDDDGCEGGKAAGHHASAADYARLAAAGHLVHVDPVAVIREPRYFIDRAERVLQ
ncbi:uncharacterized protein AMSG_01741 [Thecamonas trahens ATCC 50062]|uniref:Uncharacterized protein n=1 Tax=Thecamonas trahens ATCC 50062 TaxID=461836 RepID=A0A0L0DTC8_THETB|nr:hypothetical protein AMSG_01741 [Thecamonas trahens ATCC 50062]KNC55477.1 hypothetical protein AMSG_01741 [Thecamonas trahens ATCC 50062]|eukprot:XP_013761257.1 hypothetical protein AMSG_01741 [Thecamonas trahens ATCC 50062]